MKAATEGISEIRRSQTTRHTPTCQNLSTTVGAEILTTRGSSLREASLQVLALDRIRNEIEGSSIRQLRLVTASAPA